MPLETASFSSTWRNCLHFLFEWPFFHCSSCKKALKGDGPPFCNYCCHPGKCRSRKSICAQLFFFFLSFQKGQQWALVQYSPFPAAQEKKIKKKEKEIKQRFLRRWRMRTVWLKQSEVGCHIPEDVNWGHWMRYQFRVEWERKRSPCRGLNIN